MAKYSKSSFICSCHLYIEYVVLWISVQQVCRPHVACLLGGFSYIVWLTVHYPLLTAVPMLSIDVYSCVWCSGGWDCAMLSLCDMPARLLQLTVPLLWLWPVSGKERTPGLLFKENTVYTLRFCLVMPCDVYENSNLSEHNWRKGQTT